MPDLSLADHIQTLQSTADQLLAAMAADPARADQVGAALGHLEQAIACLRQSEVPLDTRSPAPDADVGDLATRCAQLEEVLHQLPIGVAILDGPEHRYRLMNPANQRLVGRTNVIGKPIRAVFPEVAGQGMFEILDQVYATGEPFTTSHVQVQIDRHGVGVIEPVSLALTYHPLHDRHGAITGVLATVQDVSDRVALEQERARVLQLTQAALAAAEAERQRLLTILQQAPAAICVLEGPTHIVTFTNTAYLTMIRKSTAILGQSVHQIFPELVGQGFFEVLDQVYTTGEPFVGAEMPIQLARHATGALEDAVINLLNAPIRDGTGAITGIFVQAVEVTDLVHARQEAEAAVVLRDQFLSIAAHELRTPLTSLLGYVQVLQRRLRRAGDLDARTDRMFHILRAQGQRLSRLIDALMDVARINMGHLSLDHAPLDLAELVSRVVDEVRMTAEHREFLVILPGDPCVLSGDSLRLEQVVVNLVQNALKYSPDGGPISVEVGAADDRAWMIVRDQGIGIPAAALPHLFERFYRAPDGSTNTLPGMGLGLAVVHDIVTLHGGTITVESTEGQGSTFTVTLPRSQRGNSEDDHRAG